MLYRSIKTFFPLRIYRPHTVAIAVMPPLTRVPHKAGTGHGITENLPVYCL